jgi:hypothetical protein
MCLKTHVQTGNNDGSGAFCNKKSPRPRDGAVGIVLGADVEDVEIRLKTGSLE